VGPAGLPSLSKNNDLPRNETSQKSNDFRCSVFRSVSLTPPEKVNPAAPASAYRVENDLPKITADEATATLAESLAVRVLVHRHRLSISRARLVAELCGLDRGAAA
jgi:hypothetical protein